jgi:hypothetical protein
MDEASRAGSPDARGELSQRLREAFSSTAERVHLVSYPRSGSTLLRSYLARLQGRPQLSVYNEDIVGAFASPLSHALDRALVIKSHQIPQDDGPMIYLVRDGRNATLSFLFMSFLMGGHKFSGLSEVSAAIRFLDDREGSWAGHLGAALAKSRKRRCLFVRYEDLRQDPQVAISRVAQFLGGEPSAQAIDACVRLEQANQSYFGKWFSGYRYTPRSGTIYDALVRKRDGDYWRDIFDDAAKRYFHETGGTQYLLQYGYEQSAAWWKG